jgi:hypothetical protein
MKKVLFIALVILTVSSCKNEVENTMFVKGKIKGLKKGTLYLQKQVDSLILSVDSLTVNGRNDFLLEDIIESPEIYYLTLKDSDKRIMFFGEKDTIKINSVLDKFDIKAEITGSENQNILNGYNELKRRFNDNNLDLIKEELEAQKSGNQDSIMLVEEKMKRLLKRRYLVTINYVINNADYEAAPYIALSEIYDANISMLDTINNSLSPSVSMSKYGTLLQEYIDERKTQVE